MSKFKDSLPYAAWGVALAAMLGSLYFSNIRNFPPCVLCWYQRIFMYPLVFIIGIAIFRKDSRFYIYALPLSIIGFLISVYHNLLYYKILPESVAPCVNGISCTTKYISYFGFITIPFLSMISFVAVIVLLFAYRNAILKNNA